MTMFINGTGAISSQDTFNAENFPANYNEFISDLVTVIEPDYSEWIDPRAIRRMSKIIRIGVATAYKALREAKLEVPNGIITGTSYGCLADTETFLHKMIENNEEALNPTPFIQSTHNTISGQIALLLKCYGYNQTFTQRAFSFENSLLDAELLLQDYPEKNILIGGVDEVIEVSQDILKRFDLYRQDPVSNLKLFNDDDIKGTINGEGAAYFVISGVTGESSIARILGSSTLYKPNPEQTINHLENFLKNLSIDKSQIDLLLLGKNGDSRNDNLYDIIEDSLPQASTSCFKHLSGEYPTASSFALWCAAKIIKEGKVPSIMVKETKRDSPLNTILIYNHYFGVHHSFILVQK